MPSDYHVRLTAAVFRSGLVFGVLPVPCQVDGAESMVTPRTLPLCVGCVTLWFNFVLFLFSIVPFFVAARLFGLLCRRLAHQLDTLDCWCCFYLSVSLMPSSCLVFHIFVSSFWWLIHLDTY